MGLIEEVEENFFIYIVDMINYQIFYVIIYYFLLRIIYIILDYMSDYFY